MRGKRKGMAIGLLSLVMVLVVLILCMFGVLGLMMAQADAKQSQKNLDYVNAYYTADKEAVIKLSELDRAFLKGETLASTEDLSVEVLENGYSVTYHVPIQEAQILQVQVKFYDETEYDILQWQVLNIQEDEEMDLEFDELRFGN